MGKGTRYPHVEALLRKHHTGGCVLELGAGGAVYRDIFPDYIATDLPSTPYAEAGDLDVACDAGQLPFADESFEMCFAVACLYLVPQPEQVFREVHRCLTSGGHFVVLDYSRRTQVDLAERHRRQGEDVHLNLWTAKELEALLRKSGFDTVRKLETKRHWQVAVSLWPRLSDQVRHWLMFAATKTTA